MDDSPSEIGARAEREVAYALERAGWRVYLPFFAPHARVDLIAVAPGTVLRVQCKTSRLVRGALVFRTCSNTGNVPRTYAGEVDAFGVWSPEVERAYLVPIGDVGARTCSLRVDPPASGQAKGVRWAADYEVRRRR